MFYQGHLRALPHSQSVPAGISERKQLPLQRGVRSFARRLHGVRRRDPHATVSNAIACAPMQR
jgi:hypothetical protein